MHRRALTLAVVASAATACAADVADPAPRARGGAGRNAIVYERVVRFAGLEEDVRIVKGPGFAYGIRPDGTRVGLAALREENREAHRARFGPLARGFHEHLSALGPEAVVWAAVYFQPAADWDELSLRLYARDAATAAKAREELVAAIRRDAGEIALALELRRVRVTGVGRKMPVLFIEATPAQLRTLGEDARIQLVMGAEPTPPEQRCNGGPDKVQEGCDADGNVVHHVDAVFNAQGYFGKGQRVAIFEDVGNCTLRESHEAFEHLGGNRIVYSNPTPTPCVAPHGTRVAGVISGSNDGVRCGASEVEIYYPNAGINQSFESGTQPASACHPQATLDAYEWMSDVGNPADPFADPPLAAVNESFGCVHEALTCFYSNARQWEGITQDYFARIYDLAIVKAAGNDNCGASQEACPFSLNSLCVGSGDSAMHLSCFSSSNNPGTDPNNSATYQEDREEPDVVALGGNTETCSGGIEETVCTSGHLDDHAWKGERGTSFAAPVVSSMITLFREMCEPVYGFRMDERWMRALLRSAAAGGNPHGTAYSTPKPNTDHLDGAGFLLADMLAACESEHTGGGPLLIDLTRGEEMPPGQAPYQDGWQPPGETQGFRQLLDFGYAPGPGSGRLSLALDEMTLDPGTRLRVTFSWDACAIDDQGTAPAGVAVDFDLFLYNPQIGYVWASQSLDDNNEGFDYTVQPGEGGAYRIILAWPDDVKGCEQTSVSPSALAWWTL